MAESLETAYVITLIGIVAVAVVVFVILFFVTAPYGRYQRRGWGPALHARTAWVVMELPAVVVIALCALFASSRGIGLWGGRAMTLYGVRLAPLLFLALWQVHYLYRTFVFPLLMRGGAKPFPVVLVVFAMVFNTANGFVNGYILFLSGRIYRISWIADPRFIVGIVLFVFGLVAHIGADRTLRRLRRTTENGYAIPRGGLFELVSAPNYFGEIVQWCGWAVMTWSLAGLSFAIFTIANLLPRGVRHHRWYRERFDEYPERRRAVVPYLI
jgi:hypothetical protein